ncbi:MAG: hypothetical protein AAF961_19025, partial [Planctomycetota bacterium]
MAFEKDGAHRPQSSLSAHALVVAVVIGTGLTCLSTDFSGASVEVLQRHAVENQARFESDVTKAPLHRHLGFALLGIGAALAYVRRSSDAALQTSLSANSVSIPFFLYFAWAFCSVLWSVSPHETLREVFRLTVFGASALILARHFTMSELVRMVVVITAIALVIGLCVDLKAGVFRPWTGDYRFCQALHPNRAGPLGAIMCLAALTERQRGKSRVWTLICLVGLAVVVMAKSRTGAASFLVGLAAFYAVAIPRARILGYAACAVALVG